MQQELEMLCNSDENHGLAVITFGVLCVALRENDPDAPLYVVSVVY